MPKQATTDTEIQNCFDVMAELRPHLQRDQFLPKVREMEQDGFRLGFMQDNNEIVCVAGYRVSTNLFMGKHLYVDDLVTADKHRSLGHGEKMLSWLRGIAKEEGCNVLHLDSGTQRQRAHKFYLSRGMFITSFHFAEEIK